MAEIPDPDHHQINYFLAPGRSVRAEDAEKTLQTDTTDPP